MEGNFNFEKESPQLSDKEVFQGLWSSPKKVLKYINDYEYKKHFYLLLVLAGIVRYFDNASNNNMADHYPLWMILSMGVIFGGLFAWIGFYIYSSLLSWTGKWLNAEGTRERLMRILVYASYPVIFSLFITALQILTFGADLFKSEWGEIELDSSDQLIVYVTSAVKLILSIWTLVLIVLGIAEVQKLSIGKAILNLILPALVLIIPIALVMMLFTS